MTERSAKNIPKLLADPYAEIILSATYRSPHSALELVRKYSIPTAACYRKIHELEEAGMIKCVDVIKSMKGKRIKRYRANIEGAYLTFENGSFMVKLQFKRAKGDREGEEWLTLKLQP